ncbi:MAG: GCN5-related N-acetyltransferase [Armatimonadetes bacterium]|nr:GCN5-related N-acetyltransferase [Armatimonadota bacterium]
MSRASNPRASHSLPPERLADGDLALRPPRREEAPLFARWWADPEVSFGFCSEPRTAQSIDEAFPELEAEARDIGHWIDFVIELDGSPVGSIWLSHWDLDAASCDMNILIGEPEYRGRGLARRAIRLLAAWAFPTMELRRISLAPREDHVPAIRCYRHAGARADGIRDEVVSWQGETVCFLEMYLLPEDVG